MSVDENICRLVDMGIEPEIAKEALLRTNNQLEDAINVIYSTDEPPPDYDRALIPLGGDENDNLPEPVTQCVETVPIHLDDHLKTKISQYGYGEDAQPVELDPPFSVYDDVLRTKRLPEIDPLLIPTDSRMLEGYFAPLLMILCKVPSFRDAIMKYQYEEYGYKSTWWKGDNCVDKLLVVREMQRLVAFLTLDSERAFASIRNLTEATYSIMTEEYETVGEFLTSIYKFIIDQFATVDPVLRAPLEQLFDTHIISPNFDDTQSQMSYRVFTIEKDYFSTDIYRVMHRLMWNEDFTNIGDYELTDIGDVLTVSFDGDGEAIRDGGFALDEEFYPQIYTKQYAELIKKRFQVRAQLKQNAHVLAVQGSRLRSFKGQRVSEMLESTLGYLKQVEASSKLVDLTETKLTSAVKEMAEIKQRVEDTTKDVIQQQSQVERERADVKVYDIDWVLGEEKEKLEPWILAGLIINQSRFCYLDGDDWFCLNYELDDGKNFDTSRQSFEDLRDELKEYSKLFFETGMVLFYVRKSVYESDQPPQLNEKLQHFIDEDNSQLEHDLSVYEEAHLEEDTAEPDESSVDSPRVEVNQIELSTDSPSP